jgi:hypothetical protein
MFKKGVAISVCYKRISHHLGSVKLIWYSNSSSFSDAVLILHFNEGSGTIAKEAIRLE